MPRALRVVHPGAWYYITARGIKRRAIFKDDRDRCHFLELLEQLTIRFRLRLHAYVLMPNHYHLLIELGGPNLSRAIQWLNLSYSVWFNRRHRRSGYLFRGRFKSILVDPRGWAFSLSGYIHLNPVRVTSLRLNKTDRQQARTGRVEAPAALIQKRLQHLRAYRWSSYRAYAGLQTPPAWLTKEIIFQLGGAPKTGAAAKYRAYVENQIRQGLAASPWEELRDQFILGGAEFAAQIKTKTRAKLTEKNLSRWSRPWVRFEEVIQAVEKTRGETWAQFKDRHGHPGRDQVLYLARRATNLTVADLAAKAGLKQGPNVSMAVRRYQGLIEKSRTERALAKNAAQMLFVTL